MSKKVPQPVVELVEHLRSTGTGQAKLDLIEKIGIECKGNKDVFLHEVNKQLAHWPITVGKINSFVGVVTPVVTKEDIEAKKKEDRKSVV